MTAAGTIHAGAAVVGGRGVLIRGAVGSGKSSLLLALLDHDRSAVLVADDRVAVEAIGDRLVARVPDAIAGLLEVRGVGIVRVPYVPAAAIDLVVDLLPLAECPRLPDAAEGRVAVSGVMLQRIFVAVGTADGAARVRAAIAAML